MPESCSGWLLSVSFSLLTQLLTQSTGLVADEPAEQSWEHLKQLKVGDEIQVVQWFK